VEKEMRETFKKISGEDMEIDAYELQDILNAAFAKGTQVHSNLCHLLSQIFGLQPDRKIEVVKLNYVK